MNFFDDLKTSLNEAVEIKEGLKKPAKVVRYEIADVQANPAFFRELAAHEMSLRIITKSNRLFDDW